MRSRFTINCLAFYCIIATGLVNTCFAGNNQLPQLQIFDAGKVYRSGLEVRQMGLDNAARQERLDIAREELELQNRIFEERRQQEREKKSAISADIETKKQTKDIYTELIKLDELKQKGIITEEEFETQKKKILSENSTYARTEKPNTLKSCEVQCTEMFNNGELKKGMDIDGCIEALCGN